MGNWVWSLQGWQEWGWSDAAQSQKKWRLININNMVRHCRQQVLISPFRSLTVNWDLPSSPVVKTLSFSLQVAWVSS